jgi:hypothetical protein
MLGHVDFAKVGYDKMQQRSLAIWQTNQIIPFQAGRTWEKISGVLQALIPSCRFTQNCGYQQADPIQVLLRPRQ